MFAYLLWMSAVRANSAWLMFARFIWRCVGFAKVDVVTNSRKNQTIYTFSIVKLHGLLTSRGHWFEYVSHFTATESSYNLQTRPSPHRRTRLATSPSPTSHSDDNICAVSRAMEHRRKRCSYPTQKDMALIVIPVNKNSTTVRPVLPLFVRHINLKDFCADLLQKYTHTHNDTV